jgi:hypothetical protein
VVKGHQVIPSRTNTHLFFTTGLLLGVALLIKQHALLVILAIALWHSLNSWRVRRPAQYLLWEIAFLFFGVSLPVSAFTIYYWLQTGTLKELVFWVIIFNFINHYTQWASLRPSVDHIRLLVPAYLMLPPFIANLLNQGRQDIRRIQEELGLVLLVSSSLMIYPRFGFFHLQASLPVLAWVSGTTLANIFYEGRKSKSSLYLIRGLVCSLPLLWMLYAGIPPVYNALRSGQPRKIYEYSDLVPLALLSGKRLFYPYMGEQGVFAPTFSGVTRASRKLASDRQTPTPYIWGIGAVAPPYILIRESGFSNCTKGQSS